ncbi:MAG: hypothetical protein KJ804_13370 [Proteobacteria bacterium]|nr:hypothetical protein [Pseudomonadota bacterium]
MNKKLFWCSPKVRVQCVFLILLIVAPFFFLGGPGYRGARSFVALWNLGHVFFFTLASWLLYLLVRDRRPQASLLAGKMYVFIGVLVLGIAIEGLQMGFDGRTPDLGDIIRNQLGCLITFAFFCSEKKKRGFFLYQLAVVMMVGIALYPLSRAVIDELRALRQFPFLSDFETPFEIDRWKDGEMLSVQEGIARHGHHSLKVQLTTETYSGVSLCYFPGNWQGFEKLFISVYSPDDEKLDLVCRIHDSKHNNEYIDRYNKRFILEKGWNDLVIPLSDIQKAPAGRLLNMEKIENLRLFVVKQEKERVVYIDNVYLGR